MTIQQLITKGFDLLFYYAINNSLFLFLPVFYTSNFNFRINSWFELKDFSPSKDF